MNNNFKKGDSIKLKGGKTAIVDKFLGQGGQGTVYDVIVDGKHYALKWYLPEYLDSIDQKKFYNNLLENQQAGSPSKQFLWMQEVSEFNEGSFGYIMDLRPNRFSSFSSILNAEKKIKSVQTQLTAARNICEAFRTLHRNGYSYQDINDGNFFVDVKNGEVLICDNDNIAPCGTWMGMAGKDRYMAPEVVMGKEHAGMESDLFSMAIVLYMLFFVSHPLEGRNVHACPCLTTSFMRKFYAEKPVFVYDPVNPINRPVPGIDNNIIVRWPLYPEKLKRLFTRSFTDGLSDASFRVRENEWLECFDEIEDSIVKCPVCGGELFYSKSQDNKNTFVCEDCNAEIRKPFIWVSGHSEKVLYPGVDITERTISDGDYRVSGKVVESSKHPGLWGIQNLTDKVWTSQLSNGKTVTAGKNEIIPLFDGSELNIANKSIHITI